MVASKRRVDTAEHVHKDHTCVHLYLMKPFTPPDRRDLFVLSAVMAESRRVQLTTLSFDAPPSSDKLASAQKSPTVVKQEKETCSDRPADTDTVRLVLTLFEPDERSFPEFSYSQLVDDNKVGFHPDFS